MRILDRQRYWAFFKAYLCATSHWSASSSSSTPSRTWTSSKSVPRASPRLRRWWADTTHSPGRLFRLLGSVISMMAAIFTVTWMQRNNEHLAMLAAGISTHRAIRPVLVSSVLVSLLSVINQEMIIPAYAEEIQKSHDDDGLQGVTCPSATIRRVLDPRQQGRPGHENDHQAVQRHHPIRSSARSTRSRASRPPTSRPTTHSAPIKGGWLIRGATVNPPVDPNCSNPAPRS